MTTLTLDPIAVARCNRRANELALRLEKGAEELARLAAGLTMAQWNTRIAHDGRKIGVVVHHVASMYPIEIGLAKTVAAGEPVVGLQWADVHAINASHAAEFDNVTKEAALELLRRNSAEAAAAIRAFSDEELDRAVPVSLNSDAPLTCQFIIEDHALRHSYHHRERIRKALDA